jgi:hypothetical protein
MESPRAVNRFFLAILIVYATLAIAATVYFGDLSILLCSVAAIALGFAMFGLVGILNTIMFAPIFWLMATLAARKPKQGKSDDGAT